MKVDKRKHIEPGLQIKITLGAPARDDSKFNSWDHNNTNNIVPNSIHTIVAPPRKLRRNGYFGVWVDGVNDKIFLWFHEWNPYFAPTPMLRTKQTFTRTKHTSMQRTK